MNKQNPRITEGVKLLLGNPKKAIFKLSIPMMIGMLAQAVYNLADAIWVAGLGPDALAAVGFFFPIIFILLSIATGLSVGGSSAISRKIGAGDKESADQIATQVLLFGIILGLSLSLPFIPFTCPFFHLIGAGKVSKMASQYSNIILAGVPLLFFSNIANAVLRGEGDMKRAMYAMLIGSGINILLDPIFIYLLHLGVKGAAIATLISIVITALIFFYWLFIKQDTYVSIHIKKLNINRKILKEIFKVGIPASFIQLANSGSMFFLNLVVVKAGGTDGIAIFNSGWRIVTLSIIPLIGMAMGVTSVSGAAYGAKDAEKLNQAYLYAIKIGLLLEIITALLTFIFAPQISYIFTYSKTSQRLGPEIIILLRTMVLFYIFVPPGMLSSAMFQGIGKGVTALLITLGRTIIMNVPLAYFYGITLGLGIHGVWWGIVTGNALAGIGGFIVGRINISKLKIMFST